MSRSVGRRSRRGRVRVSGKKDERVGENHNDEARVSSQPDSGEGRPVVAPKSERPSSNLDQGADPGASNGRSRGTGNNRSRRGRRQQRGRGGKNGQENEESPSQVDSQNLLRKDSAVDQGAGHNSQRQAGDEPRQQKSDDRRARTSEKSNGSSHFLGNAGAQPQKTTRRRRVCSSCRKGNHPSSECRGYRELYCFRCFEPGHKQANCEEYHGYIMSLKQDGSLGANSGFGNSSRAYFSNQTAVPPQSSWVNGRNRFGSRRNSSFGNVDQGYGMGDGRPYSSFGQPMFYNREVDHHYGQMNRSFDYPPGYGDPYGWAPQRHPPNGHSTFADQNQNGGRSRRARGRRTRSTRNFNGSYRKPAANTKGPNDLKSFDSMSSIVVNDGGVYSDEEDEYNKSPAKSARSHSGIIKPKQSVSVLDRMLPERQLEKAEAVLDPVVQTDSQLPNNRAPSNHVEEKSDWPIEEVHSAGVSSTASHSVSHHVEEENASLFVEEADKEEPAGGSEVVMSSPGNGATKKDAATDPLLLADQLRSCTLAEVRLVQDDQAAAVPVTQESSAGFLRTLMQSREFRSNLKEVDPALFHEIVDELMQ